MWPSLQSSFEKDTQHRGECWGLNPSNEANPFTKDRNFQRFGQAPSFDMIHVDDDAQQAGAASHFKMPMPLASILPSSVEGADISSPSGFRVSTTWSSATREAPSAISSSARLDFPTPARPVIKSPAEPRATAVPCMRVDPSPMRTGPCLRKEAVANARSGRNRAHQGTMQGKH